MSELTVGSLAGLAANSYVIDVASGSQLTQPGMVLQVVSATKTDTFTIASSTYQTITDLSVTITPASTSSKVLILFSVPIAYLDNSDRSATIAVFKDGSNLLNPDSPGSRTPSFVGLNNYNARNDGEHLELVSGSYLDSPASSSAITYDIRGRYNNFDAARPNLHVNRTPDDLDTSNHSRGVATLTVMEIAG